MVNPIVWSLLATQQHVLSDFVASKYETESYCLDSRYLLATVAKLEANNALYGTILCHYSKLTSGMCLWLLAKIQVLTLYLMLVYDSSVKVLFIM